MSRNTKKSNSNSRFKKLLGWTVLLALVFSAGLITGERLVRKKSFEPLVSVSSRAEAKTPDSEKTEEGGEAKTPAEAGESPAEGDEKRTEFSFFDNLTNGNQPIIERRDAPATRTRNGEEKKEEPSVAPNQEKKQAPTKTVDNAPSKQESGDALPAKYTLQVAAHPDMESAEKHMARLRKMGLDPHVISASIPDKGKFYRVRIGKFHSMDEARSFQADLKRKNSLNTFVSPI
jgi:cell division septation protein DedD